MKSLSTLFMLFLVSAALCQPTNNDCSGVISLGVAPVCDGTVYTNIAATPYDITIENEPPCFISNPPQNDVWFSFTVDTDITEINLTIEGTAVNGNNALSNIQGAIYRGFCAPGALSLRDCFVGNTGETSLSIELTNLTPGEIYYLRIDNFAGDNFEGDFTLCLEEGSNEQNIDDGGSTACQGILYDSGGPDGDYGNNENHVFTICPSDLHQCIIFNLEYYNIEAGAFGIGDIMNFYDGDNNNSPLLATLSGDDFVGIAHGGGGVCFTVYATECLTIEFISDGSNTFEGFAATWECSLQPCEEIELMTVEEGTANSEIENILSTPFTQVDVVSINCQTEAYGTFDATGNTDLGLGEGLLLTSGLASNAIGPNLDGSSSDNDFDLPEGDPDLDILSDLFGDGSESFDACVVEVDVFANTNELSFEYIFGSEEYAEWVGSFNDIFALLISGPGITDGIPEIGGQKNLAALPDGTFVEINNVNNITNWEYYRNNTNGQTSGYDGLTSDFMGVKKSLTARTEVTPCETYRLKFAIADRADAAFDSGVFISEITAGVPEIEVVFSNGLDYFVEDCSGTGDVLIIRISDELEEDISFALNLSGTATIDEDYMVMLPDTLTFLAGTTELSFPISVLSDGIVEPTETILIDLQNDFGCGVVDLASIEIEIRDALNVDIDLPQDSLFTCGGNEVILTAEGAVEYNWFPSDLIIDGGMSNTATISTNTSGWLYVTGGLPGINTPECIDVDSVYLSIINPSVEIVASADSICFGDTIFVEALNNVGDSNIQWSPDFAGIDNPNAAMPVNNTL